MARGGEDVSPGKTFGDTPPPPAQTPVRGFIIHTIGYSSTLAKCSFWRSHSLSVNIPSCGLIDVTAIMLTDSFVFLSCLLSLWARFRVLRSQTVGVCMSERVKVRGKEWEYQDIKTGPSEFDSSHSSCLINIRTLHRPHISCQRGKVILVFKPRLQLEMIPTFAALPAL